MVFPSVSVASIHRLRSDTAYSIASSRPSLPRPFIADEIARSAENAAALRFLGLLAQLYGDAEQVADYRIGGDLIEANLPVGMFSSVFIAFAVILQGVSACVRPLNETGGRRVTVFHNASRCILIGGDAHVGEPTEFRQNSTLRR